MIVVAIALDFAFGDPPTSPSAITSPRTSGSTWLEAAAKDQDELRLHRDVCAGRMTLEGAQREMLATWGPR